MPNLWAFLTCEIDEPVNVMPSRLLELCVFIMGKCIVSCRQYEQFTIYKYNVCLWYYFIKNSKSQCYTLFYDLCTFFFVQTRSIIESKMMLVEWLPNGNITITASRFIGHIVQYCCNINLGIKQQHLIDRVAHLKTIMGAINTTI